MNSYFILTIQSKNIFAINKFIRIFIKMAEFHFNYTKKLWWTKQNKKVFTILKSPHVNKSSQEQYEINKYYKQFIIRITQKFKFLVFLKTLKANLLPEVHCSVEFICNKKVSKNYFITDILNPIHFLLFSDDNKKFVRVNTELKKKIHKTFIKLYKRYLVKKNVFYRTLNNLSKKLFKIWYLRTKIKKFNHKNKIIVKLIKINKKIIFSKKLKKINTQNKKCNDTKKKVIEKILPRKTHNKRIKLKELIKKIVKSKKLSEKKCNDTKKIIEKILPKENLNKKLKLKELIKKIVKSKKLNNTKINTRNKEYNATKKIIKKIVTRGNRNKKLKLKELIKKIVKSKKLADKRSELKKKKIRNNKYFKKKLLNGKIVLHYLFDSFRLKMNKKSKLKIYDPNSILNITEFSFDSLEFHNRLLNYFFTIYLYYQFFNKNFIKTINCFLISLNLYGKAVKSVFNTKI